MIWFLYFRKVVLKYHSIYTRNTYGSKISFWFFKITRRIFVIQYTQYTPWLVLTCNWKSYFSPKNLEMPYWYIIFHKSSFRIKMSIMHCKISIMKPLLYYKRAGAPAKCHPARWHHFSKVMWRVYKQSEKSNLWFVFKDNVLCSSSKIVVLWKVS